MDEFCCKKRFRCVLSFLFTIFVISYCDFSWLKILICEVCGLSFLSIWGSSAGDVQSIWKIDELRSQSTKQHTPGTAIACAKVIYYEELQII